LVVALHMPAFLRNVDAVAFGVMNAVLRKRYSVRPCSAAPHAGFLRPSLHFFIALDVKPEMIEPDGLFFSLVQERQVQIAVGNEN
jgi:hypothetical protein